MHKEVFTSKVFFGNVHTCKKLSVYCIYIISDGVKTSRMSLDITGESLQTYVNSSQVMTMNEEIECTSTTSEGRKRKAEI